MSETKDNSRDLASFDSLTENIETGVEYQLRNPARPGETLDVFFTVRGVGSRAYREASREIVRRQAESAVAQVTDEMEVEDECRLVAALIVSWRGSDEIDGEAFDDIPYSPEKALDLMRRLPWARDQLNGFAGRRANFIDA